MAYEKSYNRYWADDVVAELGYDERTKKYVDWVLHWMERSELNPEEESVTSMADACRNDFEIYIQKYNKEG